MKVLMLLSVFLLTSCASSTMVHDATKRPKYAPKNYQQTGQVKYLNQGADWIIERRREDAFKQMYTACGGEYEVLNESLQSSSKNISNNGFGGLSVTDGSRYMYIDFKCTGKRDTASTPKEKNCGLIGNIIGC